MSFMLLALAIWAVLYMARGILRYIKNAPDETIEDIFFGSDIK